MAPKQGAVTDLTSKAAIVPFSLVRGVGLDHGAAVDLKQL